MTWATIPDGGLHEHKIFIWLVETTKPDNRTKDALAEDLRKVGVTAAGIGYVGTIMPQTNVAASAALIVVVSGFTIWLIGLLLTHKRN